MSGLPPVLNDVARWYAATTLALGERTGLLGALLEGGGSAAQLATTAGVDAHNAMVWADAMVVAGYAVVRAVPTASSRWLRPASASGQGSVSSSDGGPVGTEASAPGKIAKRSG